MYDLCIFKPHPQKVGRQRLETLCLLQPYNVMNFRFILSIDVDIFKINKHQITI